MVDGPEGQKTESERMAKKEMTQQNNNNSKRSMPVEERRKDGVAPFNISFEGGEDDRGFTIHREVQSQR